MNVFQSDGSVKDEITLTGSKVAEGIADFRLNTQGTLLASAARTVTTNSPDQINYNAKGVLVVVRIDLSSGAGGLVVRIMGKDATSGLYYFINNPPAAAIVNGTLVFELYPGSSTASSGDVTQRTSGILPRTWRVQVTHGDATSYTYSVGYTLIL